MAENMPKMSATVHQSAKMMEAQATFQKVVKQELQVLLASGLEREVAVKILLHRIVQSTEEPEENDVKRVMKQFQMNHDDAVRALIVKQEIGRLKSQGLDAFAAIEELTRKMQQISVPCATVEEVEMSADAEQEEAAADDQERIPATSEQALGDIEEEEQETKEESEEISIERISEDVMASANTLSSPGDGGQNLLCEQIDQFSISTAAGASPASLSTSHPSESSRSAFSLFSNHSRKRRVASGASSPSTHDVPEDLESQRATYTSAFHRPLSPTFRFPRTKKQKLWAEEDMVETPEYEDDSEVPSPHSPTAVSARGDTPTSSNAPTPTKVGKRRRAIHGAAPPELDDLDVDDGALVRVSKRHKI